MKKKEDEELPTYCEAVTIETDGNKQENRDEECERSVFKMGPTGQ